MSVEEIVRLVGFFYEKIVPHLPKPSTRRGRPRKFSDQEILSLLLVKEMYALSFREVLSL
ncbi:MAG: hypothetical protein H5U36_01365, partial [Candidatus Caldatribacterium sp.]|nr:hypothetical protein [Candidatus Caldatribacterium sp.]